MIAPSDKKPSAGSGCVGISAQTAAFFAPGGGLEKGIADGNFGYEARPQQVEMAREVSSAIQDQQHLAVEAGTGVGKSFAYLMPVIYSAVEAGNKAVVSTYTISLQEQLIHKDLPFLRDCMGLDFKAVLVKGRSNYVCLRRLARMLSMGLDMLDESQNREIEYLRSWVQKTHDGSLQSLHRQPSRSVWSSVCAEHGNCMGRKCREFKNCFFMRARQRVFDADILVANHHLFFSELALRRHGAAFLPDYGMAVLDEAHQVENVASEHLGIRLSPYAFEHWMRRLCSPSGDKGLLAVLREGEAIHELTRLRDDIEHLYRAITAWADFENGGNNRTIREPLVLESPTAHRLGVLCAKLKQIIEKTEHPEIKMELRAVHRRGGEMRGELEAFLNQSLEGHVYWVEQEGRRLRTVLYSAPVDVAPHLREMLFETVPSVIMTSATLAVGKRLDYFCGRIGAQEARMRQIGSPFDYARQMRILIPKGLPDPKGGDAYAQAVANAVQRYAVATRGRTFVLFTNARLMRQVVQLSRQALEQEALSLLVQGEGMPRHLMLDRFRENSRSVLFGLDSFWMGVDVRGEALSNVIITRLPFAVPDHPLTRARMDQIRETGGDPFRDYSLPEAVIKFRQGVGRLIRTANDQGTIVILDSRILTRWYGRIFLASVPDAPVEVVED